MPRHETLQLVRQPPSGLLARTMQAIRSYTLGPLTSNSPEIARLFAGHPASTGIAVSEQTALAYSAVWRAVALISSQVASLPLILYKRLPNGGKDRFDGHPLFRILHDQPNPEMTAIVFRETLQAHALTWGNAYAEIERDGGGRVAALWPLTPDRVHPVRENGRLRYRVDRPSGGPADVFEMQDILHLPGLGFDGMIGYSVIAKAREAIGLGIATERFGGTFFGNGSTFGGVLQHPTKFGSDAARNNFKAGIKARHQGIDRAHDLLLLEEGITYQQIGIPPNDAQFLETRRFQIGEIARWFGVPPHKLGDLDRATFSNIEQQSTEFLTDCLGPWLERWEQELERKLIAPSERRIQGIEHLVEGLLRADTAARYAAYAVGRQWGWLSADDIRERENMNPLPNGTGKIYFVPANMMPADMVGKTPAGTPAAPVDPNADPNAAPVNDPANAGRMLEMLQGELRQARDEAQTARAEAELERKKRADAETATSASAADLAASVVREQAADARAVAAEIRAGELHGQLVILTELKASVDETSIKLDAVKDARHADLGHDCAGLEQRAAALSEAVSDVTADRIRVVGELATACAERDAAVEAHAASEAEAARLATAAAAERAAAVEATRLAEVDTAAALARAAQAEADKVIAEQAQAAAHALIEATRKAESDRMAAVIAAHRALMVDVMGRMVRRETEKARRHQATPQKLRAWMGTFYDGHLEALAEALTPIVRAHLAWMQSEADPLETARVLAEAHIADSQRQLHDVLVVEEYAPTLERTLTRWEQRRPEASGDALVKEAVDYVRTVR